MKNNKLYWLSFSLKGKNQGICCVEANSLEDAEKVSEQLKLTPKNDDVFVAEIPELDPGIKINIFYSSKEMKDLGYFSTTELGICDECIDEMNEKIK